MENLAQIIRLQWTGGWFRCLIYRLVMPGPHVKSAFKFVKSHKTRTNRRIVTILLFKDEQTVFFFTYICAKGICDRSSSFEIIYQKACRSYGKQDSSTALNRAQCTYTLQAWHNHPLQAEIFIADCRSNHALADSGCRCVKVSVWQVALYVYISYITRLHLQTVIIVLSTV
jgi:hypothetical protein